MVSMPELTMVVSTDTVDLVCFLFFFAFAVWVAAMEVVGPRGGYLPRRLPRTTRRGDLGRRPT
jgi:hypothetical protein